MSVAIDRPLPYIRIVDVSPYRSSLRQRPTAGAAARRTRRRVAAATIAILAASFIASVGTAPAASDAAKDFHLAPGHAMPAGLDAAGWSASRGPAMTGFRLAPGNQLPVSLAD